MGDEAEDEEDDLMGVGEEGEEEGEEEEESEEGMVTGENSAMNSDGDDDEVQEVHEIKDDSDSDDGIMEVDQDDPLTAKASKGSMMDPETGEYKGKIKGPDGKLVNPSTIKPQRLKNHRL